METIEIGNRLWACLVRAADREICISPPMQSRCTAAESIIIHGAVSETSAFHPPSEFSCHAAGAPATEIWRWSILWREEKSFQPLNGLQGDEKMAFISHLPHSDSNYRYSISPQQRRSRGDALLAYEGMTETLWMDVGGMTWMLIGDQIRGKYGSQSDRKDIL